MFNIWILVPGEIEQHTHNTAVAISTKGLALGKVASYSQYQHQILMLQSHNQPSLSASSLESYTHLILFLHQEIMQYHFPVPS